MGEEDLRKSGLKEEEIEKNVERERTKMYKSVEAGTLKYDIAMDKKDSHQLALDKEAELARFTDAVGINRTAHVSGQAFNQELQTTLKLERMQARADQEQQRLKAATKAEKKLAKLKEKAEKRKIKEEQKAAAKKEAGGD